MQALRRLREPGRRPVVVMNGKCQRVDGATVLYADEAYAALAAELGKHPGIGPAEAATLMSNFWVAHQPRYPAVEFALRSILEREHAVAVWRHAVGNVEAGLLDWEAEVKKRKARASQGVLSGSSEASPEAPRLLLPPLQNALSPTVIGGLLGRESAATQIGYLARLITYTGGGGRSSGQSAVTASGADGGSSSVCSSVSAGSGSSFLTQRYLNQNALAAASPSSMVVSNDGGTESTSSRASNSACGTRGNDAVLREGLLRQGRGEGRGILSLSAATSGEPTAGASNATSNEATIQPLFNVLSRSLLSTSTPYSDALNGVQELVAALMFGKDEPLGGFTQRILAPSTAHGEQIMLAATDRFCECLAPKLLDLMKQLFHQLHVTEPEFKSVVYDGMHALVVDSILPLCSKGALTAQLFVGKSQR